MRVFGAGVLVGGLLVGAVWFGYSAMNGHDPHPATMVEAKCAPPARSPPQNALRGPPPQIAPTSDTGRPDFGRPANERSGPKEFELVRETPQTFEQRLDSSQARILERFGRLAPRRPVEAGEPAWSPTVDPLLRRARELAGQAKPEEAAAVLARAVALEANPAARHKIMLQRTLMLRAAGRPKAARTLAEEVGRSAVDARTQLMALETLGRRSGSETRLPPIP